MNCIKCGKPTNLTLSNDLDIKGVAICHKHKDEVRNDLYLLMCAEDKDKDNLEKWFNKKYGL